MPVDDELDVLWSWFHDLNTPVLRNHSMSESFQYAASSYPVVHPLYPFSTVDPLWLDAWSLSDLNNIWW